MEDKYYQLRREIGKTRRDKPKETIDFANDIEYFTLDILCSDIKKISIPEISSKMNEIREINYMLNEWDVLNRDSKHYTRAQNRIDIAFDLLSKEYSNKLNRGRR